MQIVALPDRRVGGWIALEPDKLASGRGDTPEAAVADYCRRMNFDATAFEEFSPPGRPANARMFRTRAAA